MATSPADVGWRDRLGWFTHVSLSLAPRGPDRGLYPLMVEWSLVYEVAPRKAFGFFRKGTEYSQTRWTF